MQTLHTTVLDFQLTQTRPLTTLRGWLSQKYKQHSEKQVSKRHIAYLRTLDRHILDDMGVDTAALGAAQPKLVKFIPLF